MSNQKTFLGTNPIYINLATMRVLALSDTNLDYFAIPHSGGWVLVLQPRDRRKRVQVLASQRQPEEPRIFRTVDAMLQTALEAGIAQIVAITALPNGV